MKVARTFALLALAALPASAFAQESSGFDGRYGFGHTIQKLDQKSDRALETLQVTITRDGRYFWQGLLSTYFDNSGESVALTAPQSCNEIILITGASGGSGRSGPQFGPAMLQLNLRGFREGEQFLFTMRYDRALPNGANEIASPCEDAANWETVVDDWQSFFSLPKSGELNVTAPGGYEFHFRRDEDAKR